MLERLVLVHSDRGHTVDGIRDHTLRLAEELSRQGLGVAELRVRTAAVPGGRIGGSLPIWRRLRRLGGSSAVVLQYSPFCYGRWGFAPWLPAYLLAIRAGGERPTLALMIHEPYVPMVSWRWTLMGLWQRLQLAALRLAVDVVFTSIEPWAREFEARHPRRPVRHLPVGSNFPDARAERRHERERLGVGAETLVISCLGRDHPTWLGGHVVAAVNAAAASGRPLALLNLGADSPALDGLHPAVALHQPGLLDGAELAAKLAASDIFLAPLSDGVSTRRGSLMAALQHELAVVATDGDLTDAVLREAGSALRLTAVADRDLFSAAVVVLAANPEARAATGAAGRELYEREFDWAVSARRLRAALES